MSEKLNREQRSQALAWYSTMGFTARDIGRHFGLDLSAITGELSRARVDRLEAGKSPEPVPVVPPEGEHKPTRADTLLDCLRALEAIVFTLDSMTPQSGINEAKFIATAAIKKAGRLL